MNPNINSKTLTVILDKFDDKTIVVPDYQRSAHAWDKKPEIKHTLLKSVFLGLHVNPIVLEGDLSRTAPYPELVDGQQRLTTLSLYRRNKFAVKTEDPRLSDINGKTYDKLPAYRKLQFDNYRLSYCVVDDGTGKETYIDINLGQVPATASERQKATRDAKATYTLAKVKDLMKAYWQVDEGGKKENLWKPYEDKSGTADAFALLFVAGLKITTRKSSAGHGNLDFFGLEYSDLPRKDKLQETLMQEAGKYLSKLTIEEEAALLKDVEDVLFVLNYLFTKSRSVGTSRLKFRSMFTLSDSSNRPNRSCILFTTAAVVNMNKDLSWFLDPKIKDALNTALSLWGATNKSQANYDSLVSVTYALLNTIKNF